MRPPVYTIPGVSLLLLEAMHYNDGIKKVHTSNNQWGQWWQGSSNANSTVKGR